MAEGTPDTPGRRLAADFREIRQQRGLSVKMLHEETKIPRLLIESFEETALFGHVMFNRVYLRSFVRSYAAFVGIAPEVALEALDEALDGRYQGRLHAIYIEGKAPEELATKGNEEETEAAKREDETTGQEEERPLSPPGLSLRPSTQKGVGAASERGRAAAGSSGEATSPPPDWSTQSPPGGSSSAPPVLRRPRPRSSPPLMTLAAVGAALLVVGAILFIALRGSGPTVTTSSSVDTATASGAPSTAEATRSNVELGRMIDVTVVAEEGPVRALRITRDSDLRRPYWIEEGQATVFPAEERIIIENPLDGRRELQDIRLLLERYPYPTTRRDPQGRIVITSETARAFLNNARGQPVQLTSPPDTINIPVPQ